ncbi:MAG: xanthine dehydrogenase family protein molybdopterin-binding subunit [Acidobacteriaceae bacterium]|nr:xanthine dehydrogenase family protein molybdopterin-binding subunit [Acidobacteriaceae bacterium]MBV9767623.1 xanthine dehydrogenase family protein molybdopterin-binding subunit [Acidobacteriaceae bacterium]
MNRIELATRRDFLGNFFSAGALIFAAQVLPADTPGASPEVAKTAWNPSIYLGLDTDGSVVIVAHRSEMGTGIRTSLPMVVADELEADWVRVRVEQAIGDTKYGSQNTDGSGSIRDFYDVMRETGATARLMLERAAAAQWNVPVTECRAQNHQVIHSPSGRKLTYGELAAAAAKQPMPRKEELQFKSAADFRYIGKGVPSVDLSDICTGRGIYGFDAHVPGMVYASIERPPVLGGQLKGYDDHEARKIAGVQQTVVIEGAQPPYGFQALGGVAVIANNTWAASEGRKKLKIDWEYGPHAIFDSGTYRKSMTETANKPQKVVRSVGDVDTAFTSAAKIVEANYYTPLLAHAPMEPPAALAEYRDGKVETWTATQNPQEVQTTVAKALGIKPTDVICHVTLLGGAFGRKSKPDYVAEAAILSKKVGKPVKISWTREEDIHFDYYHATSAMYFKAALDASGKPVAWLQRSVFPPIGSTFDEKEQYGGVGEMSLGFVDVPFDIPNLRAENGPAQAHVRIGWLRSVSNVYHAFGIHSFIDELAHTAGQDPIEYWLAALGAPRKIDFEGQNTKYSNYGKPLAQYPVDTGRLRRVVEVAAERSGWAKKKPGNGRALGFAAHRSFLTYVAAVVEVEVDSNGKLRIPRVDMAVDCGKVIHPDRAKAQFEGAAVFGTSIALMGEITAADGRVQQGNFNDYPVARINEAPYEAYVHFVASDDLPTGVGEPGVPPTAPAICNAVFAATGKRIRELPLRKSKLV